jgi:hypothetical protein
MQALASVPWSNARTGCDLQPVAAGNTNTVVTRTEGMLSSSCQITPLLAMLTTIANYVMT